MICAGIFIQSLEKINGILVDDQDVRLTKPAIYIWQVTRATSFVESSQNDSVCIFYLISINTVLVPLDDRPGKYNIIL